MLRNDVVGRIQMKCFLSDMPELRLGLNDQMQVRASVHATCQCGRESAGGSGWVLELGREASCGVLDSSGGLGNLRQRHRTPASVDCIEEADASTV